jgi:histidinol dehydrogenase
MMRETAAAARLRELGGRALLPGTGDDATATFAIVRDLTGLTQDEEALLLERRRPATRDLERVVTGLIDQVRTRGDDALRELSEHFDGVTLAELEVSREASERALAQLEPALRAALVMAADNIAAFHRAQLPAVLEVETAAGILVGRRADPLRRVGVYAPGGRAAYPSSVLMGVVPAKVAGVAEVVVCSPPGPDGRPPAPVLAACALAGADRVFALGGAGAVAALALGTATVPRVDRIVGPGNAYVTEAKRQLTGVVATDCPAGPSEVLVIADDSADPVVIAAELLAQAEHDPDAAAVLVTTHGPLAAAVNACVIEQLEMQPRADVIRAALRARSALLVARDLEAALAFAERYAPEHLLLMTRDPRSLLPRLHGAGTIFLGASSSVVFGDYITGANHVLPTGGSARSYSGLSTLDFVRWTTYQELSPAAAAAASAPTAVLAEAEGLPAHACAARLRGEAAGASAGALPHALARTTGPGARAAYADLRLYDPRPLAVRCRPERQHEPVRACAIGPCDAH